ncbi:MAG: DNA polymerase III subunit alpha [Proteobacteria bacterium]|nr:DNA polymerase III subunit alpha [Pseudomonadota bacterium]
METPPGSFEIPTDTGISMASSVKGWHEWICHTNFSFLIGASHPKDLVCRAAALGYGSLGVADYDGVYGIARAYRELKELEREREGIDLELHYGAEVHLAEDHDLPVCFQDTLVLYARTHRGYFNLCRLLSYSHRGGKTGANLPLEYLLSAPVEDLVAIQPMRGLIRRREGEDPDFLKDRYGRLGEHLGGNLYFAVSRHLNKAEDKWIGPTIGLAESLGSPVLLSQDAFFDLRRNKDVSDLLHAIRHNKTLDEVSDQLFVNSRRCLHSLPSLGKLYAGIPGFETALRNSEELAATFDFDLDELTYHYPKEMIPAGHTAQTYLEHLVWKAAAEGFGDPVPAKVSRLLEHELGLVKTLNFADYFLTVWDIVSWARSRDILCQGRGSAANSAICYVLGITSVNPDKFDLLFERFISVERGDPPDIDVDFENRRREEVIRYIYERYGRDRAAMVCNVITYKSRGAIRFTGKALGIPEGVIDRASKLLGTIGFRSKEGNDVVAGIKQECAGDEEAAAVSERVWELWADLSERILQFPKYLGIHSGGFMLADKEIDWLVPQEPATMEGRTVIQWSKDDIEGLGFFKIDILALGMLTAMKKCFDLIRDHYGESLTLSTLPADDPETYEMIRQADTVGVFQIESTAQRASLPVLKPVNFYDLVVQVAIIRPGPILAGVKHPYLKRRNGLEPVVYADPRLEPILKRTYGTIIFQEQLMRVAIAIGNFTPGEANEIRKNIGSFSAKGNIGRWVVKLTRGMEENGIPRDFIQEVLKQIQGFSSYGFPESHAASFALLAYASSYLKRHYPAPFFASLLNSQPMGFYQPDTLVKTAGLDGVSVLPVCVNRSEWEATLEPTNSAEGCPEYAIRLGLNRVVSLSETGAKALVEKRRRVGGWDGLEDFVRDNVLSRTDLTALAAANALLSMGIDRKAAIWLAEAAPFKSHLQDDGGQIAFAPEEEEVEETVSFEAETEMEALEADYASTRTSLGRHFTQLIREQAWVYPVPLEQIVTSDRIPETPSNRTIAVFGMILVRQSPGTAKKMLFITLEDEHGTVQIVIRPHVYARYSRIIETQTFLCVLGKLQKNGGATSVLATQIFHPVVKKADVIPMERRKKYERINTGDYKKVRNYM